MKSKVAYFLMTICVGTATVAGCAGIRSMQTEQIQQENLTENEQYAESSDKKAPSADVEIIESSDREQERGSTSGQIKDSMESPDREQKSDQVFESAETFEELPKDKREAEKESTAMEAPKGPKASDALERNRSEAVPKETLVAGNRDTNTKKEVTENHPSGIRIQKIYSSSDVPPKDTVGFVPSRKEEIMEDRYVESIVDENDPNSYQIIKKEEITPSLYVNNAGDIKYAYENGIWYEYKYCNANVTLGVNNEKLALRILDYSAEDGYEVVSVDCVEVRKEDGSTEYEFHVRYQGIFAMEGAPSELKHLKAVDIGRVAAVRTVVMEEKVPVMMQEFVGTGEYIYYGWQVLDGETFYFDQDGNKVTGMQVIQGIRYEFDENGVLISQAGIEVTEENGEIDWEKVSEARLDFAVIQCAYRDADKGRIIMDSRAKENIKGAQAAGLEVMLSVFSQAVTVGEAVEEAEAVISMAKEYGLKTPIAVTAAYANPEHNGRADELESSARMACIRAFCQTITENGYTPVLHAEADWMSDCLVMEELMDTPLWVAEYNTNLTYTGACKFWQYTARGNVDGINGYTGLIISYENRRDF